MRAWFRKSAIALTSIAVLSAPQIFTQPHAFARETCGGGGPGEIQCSDKDDPTPGNPTKPPAGGPKVTYYEYTYLYFWAEADQKYFCEKTGFTTSKETQDLYELGLVILRSIINFTSIAPHECPPAAPRTSVIRPDVIDAISKTWSDRALVPTPVLTVTPGRIVTGIPTYIEIGGECTKSFDLPDTIAGETIHIDATCTYAVNWGDPADSTVLYTTSPGGDWKTSDISHTYTQPGAVTITVTAMWNVKWSTPTESGTVSDLSTTASIPNLPVEQLEAVIGH